jgi:hypothetical protein
VSQVKLENARVCRCRLRGLRKLPVARVLAFSPDRQIAWEGIRYRLGVKSFQPFQFPHPFFAYRFGGRDRRPIL